MADIRPFRGIRYDLDVISADAFSKVVSPPYDVIDYEQQTELYESHPNNFVRIDLNRITDEDTDENDRYTRSRRWMFDWLSDGTLTTDDEPTIYVHHQTFEDATGETVTRRGFLANIRLATYDEEIVLPHERTLRGPKKDRLALMKATESNLSPVFFLYSDPESTIDEVLEAAIAGQTAARVETDDGIVHELWRVTDPAAHATLMEFMEPESVLIADGHHRYETALAYRDFRRRTAEEKREDAPYEFALGFFVNQEDPGLAVFPTHRVVHSVSDFAGLDAVIDELTAHDEFDVQRIENDPDTIQARLTESGDIGPSFVLLGDGAPALVRFTGDLDSDLFDDETPDQVRALDVCVLHEALLDGMLGISKEAQEAKTNLDYVKGWEKAFAAADSDDTQLVVLMNPTPVEQVDRVCRSGGKMPQKSTFFYPKILSGLVINPL